MTEKIDKRRIVSEEQLERLKIAREKANAVRAKKAAIRKAEKEKSKNEIDNKYNELVATTNKPIKEPQPIEDDTEELPSPKVNKPKKKVKKIIELDSDETSSSSSDDSEYDITPVKEKYKAKYKNKYASKYNKPYDPLADIATIARHNISNKVNDELKKMAFSSLFG
jgi:hypothetical protein